MKGVDPHNEDTYQQIVIPSTLVDAKQPERLIMQAIADQDYDEDTTFAIKLALEEAMTNAVRHGNGSDPSKSITIRFAVTNDVTVICVRDEGPGFVPEEIPDPTAPDRLALPCGRGIMLIRAYMSEVEYRADGREIRMVKYNNRTAQSRQA